MTSGTWRRSCARSSWPPIPPVASHSPSPRQPRPSCGPGPAQADADADAGRSGSQSASWHGTASRRGTRRRSPTICRTTRRDPPGPGRGRPTGGQAAGPPASKVLLVEPAPRRTSQHRNTRFWLRRLARELGRLWPPEPEPHRSTTRPPDAAEEETMPATETTGKAAPMVPGNEASPLRKDVQR
jgi:hypothetical protein